MISKKSWTDSQIEKFVLDSLKKGVFVRSGSSSKDTRGNEVFACSLKPVSHTDARLPDALGENAMDEGASYETSLKVIEYAAALQKQKGWIK